MKQNGFTFYKFPKMRFIINISTKISVEYWQTTDVSKMRKKFNIECEQFNIRLNEPVFKDIADI